MFNKLHFLKTLPCGAINIHNMEEIMNKSLKLRLSQFISGISGKVLSLMNALLLPLCGTFIYTGVEFCRIATVDVVFAQSKYWPIFEHLLISLVIIVCGGALLDVTLRELGAK